MIQVLEIYDDDSVLVDATNLRRVVIFPEKRIHSELVPMADADSFVSSFNSYHPKHDRWAEALRYTANMT